MVEGIVSLICKAILAGFLILLVAGPICLLFTKREKDKEEDQ